MHMDPKSLKTYLRNKIALLEAELGDEGCDGLNAALELELKGQLEAYRDILRLLY